MLSKLPNCPDLMPRATQAATECKRIQSWIAERLIESQWLCRKNQALASDDRAAAQIRAPFGEKVMTGEKGFAEHMAGMREQAQQQGSAQHSDAAHKLKEVRYPCWLSNGTSTHQG